MMSVLTARGAGVRRRRRWLFRDLDVTVEAGELVAVIGPPGSGRTTVLLALARRFRLSAGQVTVVGTAALGYVPEVEGPEPVFTVTEHVRERLALLGRSRAEAGGVPLHGLDPSMKGRDLSPYQKQVLGLILAGLSGPAVIALDGVDEGLDARERTALWAQLAEITASGTAVLVTAREIDPSLVSTVIDLGAEPAESRETTELPKPPESPRPAEVDVAARESESTADTTVAENAAELPQAVRNDEAAADEKAGAEPEAAADEEAGAEPEAAADKDAGEKS